MRNRLTVPILFVSLRVFVLFYSNRNLLLELLFSMDPITSIVVGVGLVVTMVVLPFIETNNPE